MHYEATNRRRKSQGSEELDGVLIGKSLGGHEPFRDRTSEISGPVTVCPLPPAYAPA
jgi:hypothetical protein